MEGVNTKEIELEIKGNEVEINWQSDYLQAIWWLAQKLHRYADIHSHYAQKKEKRKETVRDKATWRPKVIPLTFPYQRAFRYVKVAKCPLKR